MTKTLYFIRHGETNWNAERRMQGQWESDLNERGIAHAEQNAETAAALGVDAIYASPLRRTQLSAQALARRTGLTITLDDRLKEWSAGDWSGFLYEELPVKWPMEWAAWRNDMWRYRPPGGENFEDLVARGSAFLHDAQNTEHSKIAIVSHGFIGRAMMSVLAKLAPEDAMQLKTANDAFFRFRDDGNGWRADRFEAGAGPLPGLFDGLSPADENLKQTV